MGSLLRDRAAMDSFKIASVLLLFLHYVVADESILKIDDSDVGMFGQIVCSRSWVDTCTKVNVDFRKIGKPSMKLPVGGTFSQKDKVMFASPNTNISYYHYTGEGGDTAWLQHHRLRDRQEISLYAMVGGDQYNVLDCGVDCLLWVKTKHK